MRGLATISVIAVLLGVFSGPSPAQAADLAVTNGNDAGPGSLRAAIEAANAAPGRDTIMVPEGLEVAVHSALQITDDLDLSGAGSGAKLKVTDFSAGTSWVGSVLQLAGSATVENLTIDSTETVVWQQIEWIPNPDSALKLDRITSATQNGLHLDVEEGYSQLTVTGSEFTGGFQVAYLYLIPDGSQTLFDGNTIADVENGITNKDSWFSAPDQFVVQNNTVDVVQREPGQRTGPFLMLNMGLDAALPSGSFIRYSNNVLSGSFAWGAPISLSLDSFLPEEATPPRLLQIDSSTFDISQIADMYTGLITTSSWYPFRAEIGITNSTFQLPEGKVVTTIERGMGRSSYVIDHVTSNAPFQGRGALTVSNSVVASADPLPVGDGLPGHVTGANNLLTSAVPGLTDSVIVPDPADALLGDLAPSSTQRLPVRLPQPGSPTLDAAGDSTLTTDQRGLPRASGLAADIGAVEAQVAQLAIGDAGTVNAGSPATFPVTITRAGELPATVQVAATPGTALAGTHFTPITDRFDIPAGSQVEGLTLTVPTRDTADADGLTFTAAGTVITGQAEFAADPGTATLARDTTETPRPTPTPSPPPGTDPDVVPTPDPESIASQSKPQRGALSHTGDTGQPLLWALGGILLISGAAIAARARRMFTK
ncbi:hypothetical protein EDF62_2915 [Leucobacter luti]|uniref:Uncharacterized protein n=1 Tax=Leucobacter luti TaxID=340320 RepID=A0A4R6RVK1_9MICO|nr:choice-of-anchor Q domain-containing protein [Leucobacter luti]TDP90345.1 hypothetical protein EDF62_2915 [Leucobacter luti]